MRGRITAEGFVVGNSMPTDNERGICDDELLDACSSALSIIVITVIIIISSSSNANSVMMYFVSLLCNAFH